jgi:hypothetical protein
MIVGYREPYVQLCDFSHARFDALTDYETDLRDVSLSRFRCNLLKC